MLKIVQLILWFVYPICGLLGFLFYNRSRSEERRLMIEKGLEPHDRPDDRAQKFKIFSLKAGIVITGLGLGLLIIVILVNLHVTGQSDAIYPAILCLCGGGALVFANIIDLRKK